MFTHQELIERLSEVAVTAAPPIEAIEFNQHAFDSPSSEQTIWAVRGSKNDFPNAKIFWVKSLRVQDWYSAVGYFEPYVEQALCSPISESEFFRLVADFSGSLTRPLPGFMMPRDGFVAAMKMYGEWNDVGLIAEFVDDFVAFYWCTTA